MNNLEDKIRELISQYLLQKEETESINEKVILEIKIDTLKKLLED